MKKYLKLDIKKFKDIKDESRGRASEEFSELITLNVFYIDDEGAINYLYADEFYEVRKQGVNVFYHMIHSRNGGIDFFNEMYPNLSKIAVEVDINKETQLKIKGNE